MPIKAMFAEWNENFLIDVVDKLVAEHGWEPCYWVAPESLRGTIEERFPGVLFHNTILARKGIEPPELSDMPRAPLDQLVIEEMAYYESMALNMMDRMDLGGTFSYQERVRLYQRIISFQIALLDHLKPDVLVCQTVPHVVYDYLLYELCRKRGITPVILERTSLPGLTYAMASFEDGPTHIIEAYQAKLQAGDPGPVVLPELQERILEAARGSYLEGMPFYARTKMNRLSWGRSFAGFTPTPFPWWRLPWLLVDRWRRFKPYLFKKFEPGYTVGKGLPATAWPSSREIKLSKFRGSRALARARKTYERLVSQPEPGVPYIFVPLAHQPERTTAPSGGAFAHQHLLIEMLSRLIPNGWQLYVKEHVSQLEWFSKGPFQRPPHYYNTLAELPNVRFMPLEMSPFDLIDGAKAVALCTGTAGWEAILRGVPVFIAGGAWYRGCEGSFPITTVEECRRAIEAVQNGYQVDPVKLRLYIATLNEECAKGYNESKLAEGTDIPIKDSVAALAQEIVRVLDRGLPKVQAAPRR